MTFVTLEKVLVDTRLFTLAEVYKIISTCGSATMGNAIIACEVLDFRLTGSDVDIMINAVV